MELGGQAKPSRTLMATGIPKRQLRKIVSIVPTVSGQQSICQDLGVGRDHEIWNNAAPLAASFQKRPEHFPCQQRHSLVGWSETQVPIGQKPARVARGQDGNQFGKGNLRNDQVTLSSCLLESRHGS